MKNNISYVLVLILLVSLFSTNVLAATGGKAPLAADLNTGLPATVLYGSWLAGINSTLNIVIRDLPADAGIPNGLYAGWCIQDGITGGLTNEPGTLYASTSENLPFDLADLPWNQVNYLLNHKIRGEGKSNVEFHKDVQTAVWLLLGDTDPEFGVDRPEALQMVADANAHPDYVPGDGDILAVIVYSDGMNAEEHNSVQEAIIEFRVPRSATLTPTPTGTLIDTPTNTFTPTPTGTLIDTPTNTFTPTPTGTLIDTPTNTFTPTPTGTLIDTPTNTFTPTPTGTLIDTPTNTPTLTSTPDICSPTTVTADFTQIAVGESVEGLGVVAPDLNIDASGTATKIIENVRPAGYGAPNDNILPNGGLFAGGGFSDTVSASAKQAHLYTFTFASGVSVGNFSLRMLDYGDWNPSLSASHYVSLTAYNVDGLTVAKQEIQYTTPAVVTPRSSSQYGDIWITGDAITASPGQPGNWTWNVSGGGIVRVVLEFGAGFDPNIGFDTLTYTTECPVCMLPAVTSDFTQIAVDESVEGLGVVAPDLNIDASGTATKIIENVRPAGYGAPNDNILPNGGLFAGGGFSDTVSASAKQAHLYTFTFASGVSVGNFSLRMLDYGDWNPSLATSHYVSLTAYNVDGLTVAKQEIQYTTPGVGTPRSSNQYGDLWITGDAITASPGQPGNWTWNVSGGGIVRVVLEFGAGFDPNIGFDTLTYAIECP